MSYYDDLINKIFLGKFKTEKLLGEGSFGKIYEATDINTNEKFALKFEDRFNGQNLLEFEANAIFNLKGFGIPAMKTFGYSGENNVLVLELLGKSLESLFQEYNAKFSLKTVCMLAIQMLDRIQFIHSHHVIHRDIKPDNFLIGRTNYGEKIIYLIDFGLCKKYYNKKTFQHVKFSNSRQLTGTARYASVNALKGYEQSRRDDIEAIGYVLMYFLRGSLPWQGLKINRKDDKFKKIYEVKNSTSTEELCKGFPDEFSQYINYAKNLHFEEEPDYNFLKGLFKGLMEKNNFVYDLEFDWILGNRLKQNAEKEKVVVNNIEGQNFQMINIKNEKTNLLNIKPQPIVLNKINLLNDPNTNIFTNKLNLLPTNEKAKENQNAKQEKIEMMNPFSKAENQKWKNYKAANNADIKTDKKVLESFEEKLDKLVAKEGFKNTNHPNKKNCDNSDNAISNYTANQSLETREDLHTYTSKYKLGSNKSSNKIEYKNKIWDNTTNLEEIPELKEESYFGKAQSRVFTGMKFVYDRCEIL